MSLVQPVVGANKEISGFSSFTEHENDEEQENVANSSNESSSIGSLSSSDDDDEEESGSKESSFSSFASSLEESLPIKRGLSSYFSGKAKSFTDLSGCANAAVVDLSKPENPFNKRRRILTSWSRRASCSSLIVVQEAKEENEDEDEDEDSNGSEKERGRGRAFPSFPPPIPRLRGGDSRKTNNGFRPSFSLSDLQTSCPPNF